ncbi:MAG: ComEC/Rec2 family competence protein [Candidatus Avilachnospira sp.]|jgi:competence protein ComEC
MAKKRPEIKKSMSGAVIILLLFAVYIFSSGKNEDKTEERPTIVSEFDEAEEEKKSDDDTVSQGMEELRVEFVDVGQGDCILVSCGGENMLIDAGENDRGVQVAKHIKAEGIKELKYVIGTHPHSDHIGGIDVVLDRLDCDMLLMPDYERDIKTYNDVLKCAKRNDTPILVPEPGDSFELGSAEFTVLAPDPEDNYGDAINNYSIAILLENGETSFLLTGDAEYQEEADIIESGRELGLDMDVDVLKAGHHGSGDASSWELLEAVEPETVVISCGRNNDYGYPHKSTMKKLDRIGAEVLRTDELGDISLCSDGVEVSMCE